MSIGVYQWYNIPIENPREITAYKQLYPYK